MKGKATRLLFLLLTLAALPATAQQGRTAVLLEGPNRVRGVPFLSPNAFAAQRGVYELSGGREAELYLLQLLLEEPLGWGPFSCPALAADGVALASREAESRTLYAYRSDRQERTILIALPPDSGEACDFLDTFLEELDFFAAALRDSPLLPFPAVFDY